MHRRYVASDYVRMSRNVNNEGNKLYKFSAWWNYINIRFHATS